MPTLRTPLFLIAVSLSDTLTRVWGLFHPNNQFSQGWIIGCSVHLPYSLQGVGSTWRFCPLPQSHELLLTTHQHEAGHVGSDCPAELVHIPIPNYASTSLVRRQGLEDRLPSRISLPGKKKSGWTAKCLDQRGSNSVYKKVYASLLTQASLRASPRAPLPAEQTNSSARASEPCSLHRTGLVKTECVTS